MPEPSTGHKSVPAADPASPQAPENRPLVEGEDFYREGPYVVFTAAYHLRRGTCCGSGCRHCPWRGGSGAVSG
ncbi:MAG TPA: DUF5522 domain-containing protein [Acidobacteriaceae bacterium]